VLLVVVDALRADHVGAYGSPYEVSPNVDGLAARSVLFLRTIAASSKTVPAHASLMTSRYPRQHSVGFNNGNTMLGEEETLARVLQREGYDTGAFVSNAVLRRRVGLDAGFDVYDDELPDPEVNRDFFERTAEKTTDRAIDWLADRSEAPWFLWVHYQDPHGPYTPPPALVPDLPDSHDPTEDPLPVLRINDGRGGIPAYQALPGLRRPSQYRRQYAGEIAHFDAALGRLLAAAELEAQPTLVILTADHGESLGEDGIYFAHGHATTPDLAHVPLLVFAPGLEPGRRSDLVHHVDVLPTALELLGLPLPEGARGLALGPFLREGLPLPERAVFSDVGDDASAYRDDRFAHASEKGKPPRFYRWEADGTWSPAEHDPALQQELRTYLGTIEPVLPTAEPLGTHDRERLRALGYLDPKAD